ncbi:MAG: hypothetical protein A2W00_06255 [Candidatus Eisenbacteria bacterium RBG_16_71_46]|nr:MAG: hypothetical protein A2W00_06255 [Candidatus Eisenbacteria bacterium RBG_16_71_46]
MFAVAAPSWAATALEREYRFEADQLTLSTRDGETRVLVSGGQPEFTPGAPDLPWIVAQVELPSGVRASRVVVLALETAPLAEAARVPTAVRPLPGLGPIERSAPDPAIYAADRFTPEQPVRLGLQGLERGVNVASVLLCPARWNPQSGRLERISRLRVRIELESAGAVPVPRERVVPAWEQPSGRRLRSPDGSPAQAAAAIARPAGRFQAEQIPSLLGSPVAYVIVTSDEMAPTFQALADWKTRSGVPAVIRTTSFIRQQYPFGADDAERVRLFIRDAYSRWSTRWVLLGGDTEIIPVRTAYTSFYGGEHIPSDLYYSCLDGTWNANGDSLFGQGALWPNQGGDAADLFPEVWVGRAPVRTPAEAAAFVSRTLLYEQTPAPGYTHRDLFFAEVLFPQNWTPGETTALDGAELVEVLLPSIHANPSIHYVRLYENYTDPRWEPGALRERRVVVLDSLNAGYNIALHVGHGYRDVMSVGDDNLGITDAETLTNGNRLFNLYASNCTSNAIDGYCIGEAFMKAPAGGAVTNIGSSRFDFPSAGQSYQLEYFRLLYEDSVTAVGELLGRQKLPFVGYSNNDGVHRWTQMALLMLGDPELHLYTGPLRTLSVVHPASIVASDSGFAVQVEVAGQPEASASVTAWKAGADYAVVATDAAGNAWIPFRPDSAGSFFLTVTGYDCVPYQATVPIGAGGPPALAILPVTVDDDTLDGTAGNGDGVLDAGETVELWVPVRNNGGSPAPDVTAALSSTDPLATIAIPAAGYGAIAPGQSSAPAAGFRLSLPADAPDQHEIPFRLDLADGAGGGTTRTFQLVVRAPELMHTGQVLLDFFGNQDGIADPGEQVAYFVKVRNLGTATAHGVTVKLRNHDGLAPVSDSLEVIGSLLPGEERAGDSVTFVPSSYEAKLQLVIEESSLVQVDRTLDILPPAAPTDLHAMGGPAAVTLTWGASPASDLLGYNVYRGESPGGPFDKVNPVPAPRTSYYQVSDAPPSMPLYFQVSAVDSSGNESALTPIATAGANPLYHAGFPILTDANISSSVAVDHVYPGYPVAIATGSYNLFVLHPDGTAPMDADGQSATIGDFTTLGGVFVGGPSIGDVDGDGVPEIAAPALATWETYLFDSQGQLRSGWPLATGGGVWSSITIADLDNDGINELLFASEDQSLYVMRANGTEWMDGDSNPATLGVFKHFGWAVNLATPAVADLDNDGVKEIIYGGFDSRLFVWRTNGTNLPGFPVQLNGQITASVAVGNLDGPGDTTPEIVVATINDSVYIFEPNGGRRPGWPKWAKTAGNFKTPSPALADMNGDDTLEVILAGTDGVIRVFDGGGVPMAPYFGARYSSLTASASESSPVVADIDGDGRPDIVMGGEDFKVTAISGADGSLLAGFPLHLGAEVRGAPALCDCDGDGLSEIVVSALDRSLYVWDYDRPFSPGAAPPWPQFQHDARRTGFAGSPAFVTVPGPAPPPRQVQLATPYPNPARQAARFAFGVPADRAGSRYEVAIYDLGGRRVRTVEGGVARAGRFSAQWDLRDEGGSPVKAGVYFLSFSLGDQRRSHKLLVMR